MALDLIVGRKGEVVIASSTPLPAEVARVEFYSDTKALLICFDRPDIPDQMLPFEIERSMLPYLQKAEHVTVASFRSGRPSDGFQVPLIQVGQLPQEPRRGL